MPGPLEDPTDIRRYSNALRLVSERRIEALTQRLTGGELSLADWQDQMKAELRRGNLEQFVVGHGGTREGIKRTDYLRLGPELKKQYRYLDRFAGEIAKRAGNGQSIEFAVERAKLYARSTQASMWRAAVPVSLPQVPRDGTTQCLTNCRCRLDFKYERGRDGEVTAVLVYWKLNPAEHCEDCLYLSRSWNPKRVPVAVEESLSPLEQAVALLLMESDTPPEARRHLREMWGLEA
ncbi:MAG TPA: hypothetical protein PKD09_17985 [Aggregatilinea sp.]|uniref:hypothetical protein n=1 Tax=Aggregatilinea sp. TaxID=2806333 RepID=UPI002BB48F36|nr:hypothetical protein [Aggregatilinea sp.]HML23552.1 hypothetical protein [Aggregatilinea sp.]